MDAQMVFEHPFEQVLETLQLVQRIVTESVAPGRRRHWVVEHCRRHAVSERSIWESLACYRERGAAAVVSHRPGATIFGLQSHQVCEAILAELTWVPKEVLETFRRLSRFGREFSNRVRFLCDSMLEAFLRGDPFLEPYREDLWLDVLLDKLSQELQVLRELRNSREPINRVLTEYEDWLLRRIGKDEKEQW